MRMFGANEHQTDRFRRTDIAKILAFSGRQAMVFLAPNRATDPRAPRFNLWQYSTSRTLSVSHRKLSTVPGTGSMAEQDSDSVNRDEERKAVLVYWVRSAQEEPVAN